MEIELDRKRTLKFNVNTLAWLEEALCEPAMGQGGGSFLNKFVGMLQGGQFPGFRVLRAFLWACLKHEDKNLTLEQTGDLLPSERIGEVYEKCLIVFREYFKDGSKSPLSAGSTDSSGGVSADSTSALVN